MKQIHIVMNGEFYSKPAIACSNLESARIIAKKMYPFDAIENHIQTIPIIVDSDYLFEDFVSESDKD